MKNSWFVLVAVLALVFIKCSTDQVPDKGIHDTELQARSSYEAESCLPPLPPSCDDFIYTYQIELPDYPGCIFELKGQGNVCYALGVQAFHLGDFTLESDLGCPAYDAARQLALTNGTIAQFNIELNQEIWRLITSNILNGGTVSIIQTTVQIEYVIGSCKFQCFTNNVDCGDACCRRINIYKEVGDRWILETEGPIQQFGPVCPSNPPGGCDPNVPQSADCYDNCSSLDF